MAETGKSENARILLDLLNSVESDGGQSQRRLASELGIALGLVNAYLRRCVKKGLLKVTEPTSKLIFCWVNTSALVSNVGGSDTPTPVPFGPWMANRLVNENGVPFGPSGTLSSDSTR